MNRISIEKKFAPMKSSWDLELDLDLLKAVPSCLIMFLFSDTMGGTPSDR